MDGIEVDKLLVEIYKADVIMDVIDSTIDTVVVVD